WRGCGVFDRSIAAAGAEDRPAAGYRAAVAAAVLACAGHDRGGPEQGGAQGRKPAGRASPAAGPGSGTGPPGFLRPAVRGGPPGPGDADAARPDGAACRRGRGTAPGGYRLAAGPDHYPGQGESPRPVAADR